MPNGNYRHFVGLVSGSRLFRYIAQEHPRLSKLARCIFGRVVNERF